MCITIARLIRVISTVIASFSFSIFMVSHCFAAHALAIEDQLKIEAIGQGAADPNGRLMVWEQSPPYNTLPDYGYGTTGTWIGAYHLMALALNKRGAVAHPLFRPDPKRLYHFDSFSPDGRFVAFYSSKDGKVQIGTFDTLTSKIRYFDRAPSIDRMVLKATWVSRTNFVYSGHLPNVEPPVALRRSYGRAMWAAWNKTWAGKEPSATMIFSAVNSRGANFKLGELILIDAETGRQRVLAQGVYDTITVSHDGRYLAALREASKPQRDNSERNIDFTENQQSQLVLFDLDSNRPPRVVVPDIDICPESLAWALDNDRLAFFGWPVGGRVQQGIFRALDARNGTIILFPHLGLDLASQRERGFYQQPERAVWIGDKLAMFARANLPGDIRPRFTYRDVTGDSVGSLDKAHWFLVDSRGSHQDLTSGLKSVAAIPLNADGRSLTVLADKSVWRLSADIPPVNVAALAGHPVAAENVTIFTSLRGSALSPNITLAALTNSDAIFATDFIDESSGRMTELPVPTESAVIIASSAVTHKQLFRVHSDTRDVLELEDETGHTKVVAKLNVQLNDVIHTHWSSIKYSLRTLGGQQSVSACVLLPANYEVGHRYAVIVDVYPSVTGRRCLNAKSRANREMGVSGVQDFDHLLAAHGYIVFEPNTEKRFEQTPQGPLWAMPDVVMQGVDALISQGLADRKRLGLIGVSQGGVSSLWVASKTNIFKAVVSINGWSDYYTHFFESSYANRVDPVDFPYTGEEIRYMSTVGGPFGFGKSPEQAPTLYASNSPLLRAVDILAPTLLIHSDMDAFSMEEYEAMFTALDQNGKIAKLIEYWGEGHTPSSPANMKNMWENIFAWYDKYLAADSVPGNLSNTLNSLNHVGSNVAIN